LLKEVKNNKGAIGYAGLSGASAAGVKHIHINGIDPNPHSIGSGKYPISRELYFYYVGKPGKLLKDFVSYHLSLQGQAVVAASGLVPLTETNRQVALRRLGAL
jgi:phosphate transport system substrate-binding protein